MTLKNWWLRHQIDGPDPAQYDDQILEDSREAQSDLALARDQRASVRRLKPKSDKVHRGMKAYREENNFAPRLFMVLREGPQ